MLVKKNRSNAKQVEFACIDQMVTENHLVIAVGDSIDFSFIYDEVKEMYPVTVAQV